MRLENPPTVAAGTGQIVYVDFVPKKILRSAQYGRQINNGWLSTCNFCGAGYTLPFTAGTIRDGRQERCTRCYLGRQYGR